MKNFDIKKSLLLIFILFIFLSVIFSICKYSNLQIRTFTQIKKPIWLSRPIPDVDKIKSIIKNPKFKSLEYHKAYFSPIKINKGQKGRPNPFVPFASPKEKS